MTKKLGNRCPQLQLYLVVVVRQRYYMIDIIVQINVDHLNQLLSRKDVKAHTMVVYEVDILPRGHIV